MDKKKSTGILLSILGVISLVLITAGVTYAFFTYSKAGKTENTITTGTITFYYDELEAEGNGIKITDAIPTSDVAGKATLAAGQVFNFKVTATSSGNTTIPYEITARKESSSTLDENAVKLYLTKVNNGTETDAALTVDAGTVKTYGALSQTSKVSSSTAIEKTIYVDSVPASTAAYEQNFRLRMWLSDAVDYTPFEYINAADNMITSAEYDALTEEQKAAYSAIAYADANGVAYTQAEYDALGTSERNGLTPTTQVYPINGKTFTVKVNVYANATVVSVPSA